MNSSRHALVKRRFLIIAKNLLLYLQECVWVRVWVRVLACVCICKSEFQAAVLKVSGGFIILSLTLMTFMQ